MAKKIRLIARLDVKNDHLVKGIQLEGLRKLGDPHDFAADYYRQGVDELLYMDIVASLYNRNNLSAIVRRTTDDVFIPITVYGGRRLCAAAQKGSVIGCQFHPEKSGKLGLSVIHRYLILCEAAH